MSVKERLEQFCEYRGITIGTFCRLAKISNSYFSNVKGPMGIGIRGKIKKAYEELNVNWLMTGEGEMLLPSVQAAVMSPYPVREEKEVEYCDVEECENTCPQRLPYVKSEIVQARDVDIRQLIESSPQKLEHRSMRQMIGNPNYIQKVITAAMMPLFQPGDVLFIQFLPEDAKIISGAIYLVDTKAYGAMVRQVYVEDDLYVLHSLNPEYKELQLHREEIYSISLVVRSLRSDFNMPKPTPDASELFRKREEQVERLLSMHSDALTEIRMQNERMAEERRRQDEERKAQFDLMSSERERQDKLIERLLNLKQK